MIEKDTWTITNAFVRGKHAKKKEHWKELFKFMTEKNRLRGIPIV